MTNDCSGGAVRGADSSANLSRAFRIDDFCRFYGVGRTTAYKEIAAGRLRAVKVGRPDSAAVDQGDNPQWLYTVVFTGNELWGADADPTVQVSIEAFEPYLESA